MKLWETMDGWQVMVKCMKVYFWSNYSNLTRPISPKWWFSKGHPTISGFSRLVKYYSIWPVELMAVNYLFSFRVLTEDEHTPTQVIGICSYCSLRKKTPLTQNRLPSKQMIALEIEKGF